MKIEKNQEKIVDIFSLLIIGIVLFMTIFRLFFGAELTDEAYSVAETYMVSEGALPFVNNWSQMPGWSLLRAPFIRLYTTIVGGTDGIFLFFRFLTFLINVITAYLVSYLLKDYIKNNILLLLLSMVYVGATGYEYVVAFRGDNLAVDLMAVGVLLLALSFIKQKNKISYLFGSGALLALAIFSYPPVLIEFVYFVIVIIFLCAKRKEGYKKLFWFIAGSGTAAVIITGYLVINSSFSDLFLGINYLLSDVTYFQIKNEGIVKLPGYVKIMALQLFILLRFILASLIAIIIIWYLFFRRYTFEYFQADDNFLRVSRDFIRKIFIVSLLAGVCLYHFYLIWIYKMSDNTNITLYAITIYMLVVPFLGAFIKKEKKLYAYLMALIWFPSYILVIVTGINTYSDILHRHILLKNTVYLFGVFVVFAVKDNFLNNCELARKEDIHVQNKKIPYIVLSKLLPVLVMMTLTFTYIFNSYTYVYRDDSLWRLDTIIPSGPYRGIRTSQRRADGLVKLEAIIDDYVSESDYVLAMDNDPFIYLMCDGKICTPSTWDMALYSYGFDQPDLYYDYFAVTGIEPTKIIYFNYGRDKVMSIDTSYKFNDYVNYNYHLIYENRNIFVWDYDRVTDNMCELLIYERN